VHQRNAKWTILQTKNLNHPQREELMDNKPNQAKLWTLPFFLLIVLNLLVGIVQISITTTMPIYVVKTSGSVAAAGMIVAIFSFAALFSRPVFGHFLDRHDRRLVLLVSTLIYGIGHALLNFPMSVELLLLLRIVHGVGFGGITTTIGTMVAELLHPTKMVSGIGIFGMAYTVSTAVGPIIAFAIVNHPSLGFPALYIFLGIVCGLSFLLSFLIKDHRPHAAAVVHGHEMDLIHKQMKLADRIYEKTALAPSLVMLFMALSISGIFSFMTAYASWRGIADASLFFTVYAITILVVRVVNDYLIAKLGYNRLILVAMGMALAGLLVLAVATKLEVFLIIAVLYGFGFGIINPLLNALVMQFAPVARRGTANATYFLAMDIGMGFGSMLLGLLPQLLPTAYGYPSIYFVSAGLVLIGVVFYLKLLKPRVHEF
jgi:MFS family permease